MLTDRLAVAWLRRVKLGKMSEASGWPVRGLKPSRGQVKQGEAAEL